MRKKIAVIGAGVAGIVSAYLLDKKHDVTIYEAASYLGGHTNTIETSEGNVDTGFIVLNDKNYPNFSKFLKQLNVDIRYSDMSFAFESKKDDFYYAGTTINGVFAQRKNIFSSQFYKFLNEIRRFCRTGANFLKSEDETTSLGKFLSENNFSSEMINYYLIPMGAAIWSVPEKTVLEFPAKSYINFFANHGLLSFKNRPQWQTVVGGSFQYVKRFQEQFSGKVKLNSLVMEVSRDGIVKTKNGDNSIYDIVVLATHADMSFALIKDKTELEQRLLGAWKYQDNYTVLHTDISFLPKNKRAWASWNYVDSNLTYHMNRLQGLETKSEFCVTLNPVREINKNSIIREINYQHPIYDSKSVASQKNLSKLQGENRRYFCGSYFGYGFHEDAVRSAVEMAKLHGINL